MNQPLDWEFVRTVIMLVNLAGTAGVALFAWMRKPSEANSEQLKELREALQQRDASNSSRFDKIETRLQFIPTVTELGKLQADVREVTATQQAMQRDVHRMSGSLTRIEDFLLKK